MRKSHSPVRAIKAFVLALAGTLGACTVSCSLDYGDMDGQYDAADTPNTILYQFKHTIVKNGSPQFTLVADRAENYEARKLTKLFDVGFIEYDKSGKPVTTGTATDATLYTDTDDVELNGIIECYSSRDGLGIEAKYLYWNNSKKRLTSRSELLVSVTKDDGSALTGSGFEADGRSKEYWFSGSVEGSYNYQASPSPSSSAEAIP
jgi:LPS export ABC transporter protein LptC